MTALKAGELKRRIMIQQITGSVQQASGEDDSPYVTIDTVWGKIEPLTGKELELAQIKSIGPATTLHVTIRWYSTKIDPKTMRLAWVDSWGTTVFYAIDAVLPSEAGKISITMYCTEWNK